MTTVALRSFKSAQASIDSLLRIESRYRDPPTDPGLPTVEGLRGGSAVLMVGVFEAYLKESIAEALDSINRVTPSCRFDGLPEALQVAAVYSSLEAAMKGDYSTTRLARVQRIAAIKHAAERVHLGRVDGAAIAQTGGNPSAEVVKQLFKSIGRSDIFTGIKVGFDSRWGVVTASTFPADMLDVIVGRRHLVAHTGRGLSVSRGDLVESHRFLGCLADELDVELEIHVHRVIEAAQ